MIKKGLIKCPLCIYIEHYQAKYLINPVRHKMNMVRRLITWFWRAWPLILIVLLLGVHFSVLNCLSYNASEINKTISLAFQIIGGLLVLYSIDSNIGIIKKNNLLSMFLDYIKEFPLVSKSATLNIHSSIHTHSSLDAVLTVGRNPKSVEEKLEYLQEQIVELKNTVERELRKLTEKIEKETKETKNTINKTKEDMSHIKMQIEKVSIGGIKAQIFGVLLIIYGSIVSYIA